MRGLKPVAEAGPRQARRDPNMARFQIVSDSSCDLGRERAEQHGVTLVSFYVSFEIGNNTAFRTVRIHLPNLAATTFIA